MRKSLTTVGIYLTDNETSDITAGFLIAASTRCALEAVEP